MALQSLHLIQHNNDPLDTLCIKLIKVDCKFHLDIFLEALNLWNKNIQLDRACIFMLQHYYKYQLHRQFEFRSLQHTRTLAHIVYKKMTLLRYKSHQGI